MTLLLPPDSAGQPNRRWPAFHLTSHTDVLVMMPEAGPVGFYANWWNHGAGGPPAWETFHLTEIRQILERGLPRRHRCTLYLPRKASVLVGGPSPDLGLIEGVVRAHRR